MDPIQPDASAESSPAPLASTDFLETLSPSERESFFSGSSEQRMARMSKPDSAKPKKSADAKAEAPKPAADAESAPAKVVDQPASTDAKQDAASETAKPAKDTTPGLDAREKAIRERQARLKADLDEIDRLEREVTERRSRLTSAPTPTQDAPPDSSPAATAQKAFEKYASDPNAPKLEQYDDYNAWAIDMMDYITDRKIETKETEQRKTAAEARRQHELQSAVQTSQQRVKAFVEKTPDFATRVNPSLMNIVPLSALGPEDPVGPQNFIAEQMWRSEYPGELALHFSEHPDEFQALMELADPAAIVKRIGKLEARFESTGQSVADPTPAPKTIPDADELPVVIGKKAPVTASDAESALASKDFSAYERARRRDWGLKD